MAHVVVIVLGDVGRSPRMQRHAHSLAEMEQVSLVSLVGYSGEPCFDKIETHPKIKKRLFEPMRAKKGLVHTVIKGVLLCWQILYVLLTIPSYDVVLIQNPPSLPVAAVAFILSFFFNNSSIVIDWHNLGYTLYDNLLPPNHILVRIYRFLESLLGRVTPYHICVSEAMRIWLHDHFGTDAVVVYDKPSSDFCMGGHSVERRHALLMKLRFVETELFYCAQSSSVNEEVTVQTRRVIDSEGAVVKEDSTTKVVFRKSRQDAVTLRSSDRTTAVVVTSTSWTPDEDMSLLLDAIKDLDAHMKRPQRVLVVVTGKGPLKIQFEPIIKTLNDEMSSCVIRTVWLEPEEYPVLMGCADVGVCLHTSSSGLDLPMKVLDMFGSGVPVCAVEFPAISELVVNGINGITFKDAEELSNHLNRLLSGFPRDQEELSRLRKNVALTDRWDSTWVKTCEPTILKALQRSRVAYGLPRNRLYIAILLSLLVFFFSLESLLKYVSWPLFA